MKTIIIASLFCMDNFLPILIGLLGAALLGWLLHHFLKGGSSSSTNWETKYNSLSLELEKEKQNSLKLSADLKNKKSKSDNTSSSNSNIALGTAAIAGGIGIAEAENLKNNLKKLKEELAKSNQNKLELEAQLNTANTLAKEATHINSELETSKVRIEGLAKALDASKAEAEKYKGDFDNANGERSRLTAQLGSSDIGAMQKRIDKLESDLDTARMTSSNLQTELDRAKNGAKSISQVIEPKKETTLDSSNTREQLIALEKENATLKATNEKMAKDVELSKFAITAAVNDANAKNNKEIIELRNKVKSFESTITKLEDDKTKLASAISATNVKVKEVDPIAMAAPIVSVPVEKPIITEAPKVEPITNEKLNVVEPIAMAAPIVTAPVEKPIITEAPKVEPISTPPASPVIAENKIENVPTPVLEIKKDNLEIIEGIGPKIAELINANGIHTFAQLADSKVETLHTILHNAGEHFRIHNPSTWAEQAALLRDGKMDEFKKLCAELDGGVRVVKFTETEEDIENAKKNPDDLKVIEGVGPVIEKLLNDNGIYTYKQMAAKDANQIKAMLEANGDKLHDPTTWAHQSALLRDGKMEEFKELTDRLKGGREV